MAFVMEMIFSQKCYQSDGERTADFVYPSDVRAFKTDTGWRKHYNRLVARPEQAVDFTVTDASGAVVARLLRTTEGEVLMNFAYERGI